jgi:Protein of unknown function (DUF2971)
MVSEILYKYRNWNNDYHKSALLTSKIYFASPKDLNDPFDAKIHPDISLVNTDELRSIYTDQILKHQSNNEPSFDPELWRRRFIDSLKRNPTGVQKLLNKIGGVQIDDHIGVYSLCATCLNNQMWAYYADSNRGFCIGYDTVQLETFHKGIMLKKVKYFDPLPRISPIISNQGDTYDRLAIKNKHWEREEEFRLLANFEEIDTSRLIQFPKTIIKEVVFGLNISDLHRLEILEFCDSENIKVFKIIALPYPENKIVRLETDLSEFKNSN